MTVFDCSMQIDCASRGVYDCLGVYFQRSFLMLKLCGHSLANIAHKSLISKPSKDNLEQLLSVLLLVCLLWNKPFTISSFSAVEVPQDSDANSVIAILIRGGHVYRMKIQEWAEQLLFANTCLHSMRSIVHLHPVVIRSQHVLHVKFSSQKLMTSVFFAIMHHVLRSLSRDIAVCPPDLPRVPRICQLSVLPSCINDIFLRSLDLEVLRGSPWYCLPCR